MMSHTSSHQPTRRFSVGSLFLATTVVAILLVGLPLATRLPFELAVFLTCCSCLFAATLGLIANGDNIRVQTVRIINGACLGCLASAMVLPWLRTDLYRTGSLQVWWLLLLFVATVCLVSTGLRSSGRSSQRIELVERIAAISLVAALIWQYQTTSDERYLVSRYRSREGHVSYRARSNVVRLLGPPTTEQMICEYIDGSVMPQVFEKLRFYVGLTQIQSVSFINDVKAQDWEAIRAQDDLVELSFVRLSISGADAAALGSVTSVHQMSFFECEFEPEIMRHFAPHMSIGHLQLHNCTGSDLSGLSSSKGLYSLWLENANLRAGDLREIASLPNLRELSIKDVSLSDEMLKEFSQQLAATGNGQPGRLAVTLELSQMPNTWEGIERLVASVAIGSLTIDTPALPDERIQSLQARYPKFVIRRR